MIFLRCSPTVGTFVLELWLYVGFYELKRNDLQENYMRIGYVECFCRLGSGQLDSFLVTSVMVFLLIFGFLRGTFIEERKEAEFE
jgi:hypothetical protein